MTLKYKTSFESLTVQIKFVDDKSVLSFPGMRAEDGQCLDVFHKSVVIPELMFPHYTPPNVVHQIVTG